MSDTQDRLIQESKHLISLAPYQGVAAERILACFTALTGQAEEIRKVLDRASNEGRGDKWAIIQIMNITEWTGP